MKRSIKILLGPIVAAVAAASPLTAAAQVNAEQMVNIGRNVLSMEDYMLAIQYFNQAIKAKPYLAEPYFLRALAKLNLEDYQGAEQDCSASIERNKFITEAYKLRGFCRQNLRRDSLAIEDYDIGLKYEPTDKYFMFYKGVALLNLERAGEADTLLTRAIDSNPKFSEAYSARARARLVTGDTIQAMQDIDRSIELSSTDINNYLMRADVHVKRREWQKAAADMDEVIRLDPQNADMYVNRAWLRYNIDSYAGALADYNYALELDPDNTAATYNRALLRLEYLDMEGAYDDFSRVLNRDPGNFHALYNRAIIALNLHKWRQAIADFTAIQKRYPKFYPIYYGIAQARQGLGDQRGAIQMMLYADDMVRKYVDNPRRNPLDRPAIEAGVTNDRGMEQGEGESEIDVMERFNRLVTVNETEDVELKYADKIKGRVQDRSTRIDPEPMFAISIYDGRTSLRPMSNYFKEIEDINRSRLLPRTLYITNSGGALTQQQADELFAVADDFTSIISTGNARPIDYLGRGVVHSLLKNYDSALADLDKAVEMNPQFTAAYLARATVKDALSRTATATDEKSAMRPTAADAMADLDKAVELNPRLIYAWFDKGNIYYNVGDYTTALQCYSRAIELNPEYAEAYYNRGLTYLALGNRQSAFADLSRAGELGILPSYKVLKGMK